MAASIGMMDAAYFVGRGEILSWINATLHLNLSKVEEVLSYCLISPYLGFPFLFFFWKFIFWTVFFIWGEGLSLFTLLVFKHSVVFFSGTDF